jgi:lipoprotein NlpD
VERDPRAVHHLPWSEVAAHATAENGFHALGKHKEKAFAAALQQPEQECSGAWNVVEIPFERAGEQIRQQESHLQRQPQKKRQQGKVVTSFSRSGGKGIDIAGKFGQVIVAASDGSVVYSGSGLIGYGQLIIVKHNKRYLSAYAHNNKILVKEGDTVKGGQRIAEMGRSGSNRAMLHFEIRRDGKPIDPMRYLPK